MREFETVLKEIVSNQGEEWKELTRERGNQWISEVSRGDTAENGILESGRVCDRHFVSGKAAATWDKHNIDWVPTLHLGKMGYKGNEQKEKKRLQKKGPKEQRYAGNAPLNDKNTKLPRRGNI